MTFKGRTHTEEVRKRISDSRKAYWDNPENRAHQSNIRKGKPFSEEHKAALSAAQQARAERLRAEKEVK